MHERSSDSSTSGALPPSGKAPLARLQVRKRLLNLVYVVVALGGVLLLWWFVTADEGPPEVPAPQPVGVEIRDLQSLLVRREGKRLWELQAERIEVAADGSQTVAERLKRGVLFREDKPYLVLKAPKMTLTNATNDLSVSGGLELTGPEQLKLTTARANWKHFDQLLQCPKPVQVKMRSLILNVPRLNLAVKSGTLTAPGPVEVIGKGVRMRGENVEAKISTRVVTLRGQTEMTFYPGRFSLPSGETTAPVN